jgi:predicted nucleotidyltransferase
MLFSPPLYMDANVHKRYKTIQDEQHIAQQNVDAGKENDHYKNLVSFRWPKITENKAFLSKLAYFYDISLTFGGTRLLKNKCRK